MIELKDKFEKHGDLFTQELKNDKYAIYRRSNSSYNDVFEVFKLRTHAADFVFDDTYEVYPSTESFGDWAWCCNGKHQLVQALIQKLNLSKEEALKIIKTL